MGERRGEKERAMKKDQRNETNSGERMFTVSGNPAACNTRWKKDGTGGTEAEAGGSGRVAGSEENSEESRRTDAVQLLSPAFAERRQSSRHPQPFLGAGLVP